MKFTVQARTHSVTCDQPQDNGGTDAGMTPPKFLLASLGACAGFYAAEYLRTRNLANVGVSVSVTADKVKGPARIDNFRIRDRSPVLFRPPRLLAVQDSTSQFAARRPEENLSMNRGNSLELLPAITLNARRKQKPETERISS